MTAYIGLGSNLGDRLKNLESAAQHIKKQGFPVLKASPVYETPALLPPTKEADWNRPFLNGVIQVDSGNKSPLELLHFLKSIEKNLGRQQSPRWAPRVIDLDILLFGKERINTLELKIPHPEIMNRNFVLAPLKDLNPSLKIPFLKGPAPEANNFPSLKQSNNEKMFLSPLSETEDFSLKKEISKAVQGKESLRALECFRLLKSKLPAWMYIINITPDSFSDGGKWNLNNFSALLQKISDQNIQIIDLGAESTRPGAKPIPPREEEQRLNPYIELFFNFYKDKIFRPRLSVDTRYSQTARQVAEWGVDIINDVKGLSDQKMLDLLKDIRAEYVLTHSLTIPADPKQTLPIHKNPIEEIKKWLEEKIHILEQNNIPLERIIFDPGIGFGKTADQSLEILKNIEKFYDFPFRIMLGHSRKSFMKIFSPVQPEKRDPESIGISLALAKKGVDILRVHSAELHARAFLGASSIYTDRV